MNYDVFISCKSEDYPYAESIYDFLRQNGINTFLASKELRILGDSEYRKAISMALASAYHMVVFASKAEYIDADWVFYEWDWFITAKLKRKKPGSIITILKDIDVDTINPDLWKYESFSYHSYQERILSYVETPSSKERKKAEEERSKIQQKINDLVGDYKLQVARLNVLKKEIVKINQVLGCTTKKCPVCDNSVKLSDAWCDRCGYYFHPMFSLGGEKEVGLDRAYLSHFRTIWKSQQVLSEQQSVSDDLAEALSELKKKNASLETELKSKDYRLASAEKRYNEEITKKEERIRLLEREIDKSKVTTPAKQTEFDVFLSKTGPAKLQVIKVVKENTGLGLKEAKELVDRAPVVVKKKVSKAEAEALKAELEGAGAKVVIEINAIEARQMEYNVNLVSAGPAKLQVIKAVKENTGLGLKEAKELVDRAPVTVKKKVSKAEAEALKAELEGIGAKVTIQQA